MAIGLENVPRLSELVRRAYGSDELVPPGVVIDSLELSPELRYLAGERLWVFHGFSTPPGAGVNGAFSIFNPTGSKIVTVVTKVLNYDTVTSLNVQVNRQSVQGTVTSNVRALDGRSKVIVMTQSAQKVAGGVTTSAVSPLVFPRAAGNPDPGLQIPNWSATLMPGDSLIAEAVTANVAYEVCFFGYERQAREEELAE